jgi:glyoxylase-like metal-dependent hydrolase (beta-lactamase superfamily II)
VTDDVIDLPPPIVPGVARALSPLVRRIAVDLDGEVGPNTYLVGIDEIAVIDPGPDLAHHLDAIAGCGGDRVRWILSTGTGDQSGAAGLAKRTGAEIVAVDGVGPDGADSTLAEGDTILGTEFRLVAMVPPTAHGPRALFFLEEERVLFGGDVVVDRTSELLADRRLKRLRGVAPAEGQLVD